MSFSSEVKEELAKQFGRSRHCQIAELAGILELEGMLDPPLYLRFHCVPTRS